LRRFRPLHFIRRFSIFNSFSGCLSWFAYSILSSFMLSDDLSLCLLSLCLDWFKFFFN
jgi:hypothetical protein